MCRDTGDLSHALSFIRVECGARQDAAIPLENGKVTDLFLEAFAGPLDQRAIVLEWSDQLDDTGDVVDVR